MIKPKLSTGKKGKPIIVSDLTYHVEQWFEVPFVQDWVNVVGIPFSVYKDKGTIIVCGICGRRKVLTDGGAFDVKD